MAVGKDGADAPKGPRHGARGMGTILPSHYGPGSQWGKPYYHLGQECEKNNVPKPSARTPMTIARSASSQTRLNDVRREKFLHVYSDPPSARSCRVAYGANNAPIDGMSHYTKIGSKHLCEPRGDHPIALARSSSSPEVPWGRRRELLKDQTPHHFNAAFTTTSGEVGRFYHHHLMRDPNMFPKSRYDWIDDRANTH
eukprot:TRINITY_DN43896_c0_g1_i1.p1 TRINITY_DN43896_c0_g1~~TRINITY_DN43896_c0_g1_i1.p1  ORF type:complete len:213 (-),score=18.84 TRINITY_DN43896_c0_g1_i1:52-642(-)